MPLEMYVGKTNALLNRAATRDLYDTFYMIRHHLIPENLSSTFRKRIVFYTAISSETSSIYVCFWLDYLVDFPFKSSQFSV